MRKYILTTILSSILAVSMVGQCGFPVYENYGLICDQAKYLCGYEMDGFTGQLLTDKSPTPQPDPLCAGAGEADNIQWFSFVADAANLELIIRYSDCTNNILEPGLQVGIFNSCELDDTNMPLGSIFCIEGTNYTDIVLSPNSAEIEPGQLYYLFVDGYAGSACDFEIEVVTGICTEEPDTTTVCEVDCGVTLSYGGDHGCTMFQDTFYFLPTSHIISDVAGCNPDVSNTRLDSIICVEWDIQPPMGFSFVSTSFEYFDSIDVVPTLVVEWHIPGTYTVEPIITFNPLYTNCPGMCNCTESVVYTIEVQETTLIQLSDVELCPGECLDFCGEEICDTGDYECKDRDLCLIEYQSVVAKTAVDIDLGTIVLCPGECFDLQDVQYCDANTYSIVDTAACDTTYLFDLEDLELSLNLVQDDDLIDCISTQAFLEGGWTTNYTGNIISAWISETGDTVAHGSSYTALDEGDYTFVAWPEDAKMCLKSIVHSVSKDDVVPSANLTPPMLDCNNPTDVIQFDSQDAIASVDWTGPGGFVSDDMSPEVVAPGTYTVTITGVNGCVIELETVVMADFETPTINVDFENLTCSEDIPTASYETGSNIVIQTWTLPDASTLNTEILNLNDPGSYSLQIVADNGCVNQADFNVVDMSYDPSLQLDEDKVWRCLDKEIVLDLADRAMPGVNYTWSNLEGTILSNTIDFTITGPGTYVLTSIDNSVECIGRDTVIIEEDPNPFLDVVYSILPPLCAGGEDGMIQIEAYTGGTGPYTYKVDGNEFADMKDVMLPAGNYEVEVKDVFGCTVIKELEVPPTAEIIIDTEPELSIRYGQEKTLSFETNLTDAEIGLIQWTDPEGEILGQGKELDFTGEEIEAIYLFVQDLEGCEARAEIRVNLSYEVDIYFPNVFSPNGDGNNDLFILYNNGFPEMADDLKIYDRSGELIYKSSTTEFNETKVGWDGTFNGQPCQPGVYVFILQYTLMNGRKQTASGSITLVR